eukprot:c16436_g1_i3.p1 GENE.c16436_g1_i3~~c16436_g1_i3.p1  ORF type:complete len:110 (-),score=45.01 c16436_g1_i3:25-354(-)
MTLTFPDPNKLIIKYRSEFQIIDKPQIILDGRTKSNDNNLFTSTGTGDDIEVIGNWKGNRIVTQKHFKNKSELDFVEIREIINGHLVIKVSSIQKDISYFEIYQRFEFD